MGIAPRSNEHVLQRVSRRDPRAFPDCIALYGPLIWSLSRRSSRTAADAEDATQEIFLSLWQNAVRFDPARGSEKAFVATLARRRLVDRLRKSYAQPTTESLTAELSEGLYGDTSGPDATEAGDGAVAIRALAHLRPIQRQVLELAFLRGLTQSQIAVSLALPLGTVKSFMRRGLVQVRKSLTELEAAPRRTSSRTDWWVNKLRFTTTATAVPPVRIALAEPCAARLPLA